MLAAPGYSSVAFVVAAIFYPWNFSFAYLAQYPKSCSTTGFITRRNCLPSSWSSCLVCRGGESYFSTSSFPLFSSRRRSKLSANRQESSESWMIAAVSEEQTDGREDELTVPRNYGNLSIFENSGPFDLRQITQGQIDINQLWSRLRYRIALFCALFVLFPVFQNLAITVLFGRLSWDTLTVVNNVMIWGGFMPSISVLFSTTSSFIISYLVQLQNSLKVGINKELSATHKLAQCLEKLQIESSAKESFFEQLYIYQMTVAAKNKQDEINLMLYQDPLSQILGMLYEMEEAAADGPRPLAQRAADAAEEAARLRQERLTYEGQLAVPPVLLALLRVLAIGMALGFLALCDPKPAENTLYSVEARFFFALLVTGLLLAFDLLRDLSRPFDGVFSITPQVLTNADLLRVRNILRKEMGQEWLDSMQEELNSIFFEISKLIENEDSKEDVL